MEGLIAPSNYSCLVFICDFCDFSAFTFDKYPTLSLCYHVEAKYRFTVVDEIEH